MSAVRPLQLTLAVLKPDLLMRPPAARAVRERIAREGFHVVKSAVVRWSREDAEKFYNEHRGQGEGGRMLGLHALTLLSFVLVTSSFAWS